MVSILEELTDKETKQEIDIIEKNLPAAYEAFHEGEKLVIGEIGHVRRQLQKSTNAIHHVFKLHCKVDGKVRCELIRHKKAIGDLDYEGRRGRRNWLRFEANMLRSSNKRGCDVPEILGYKDQNLFTVDEGPESFEDILLRNIDNPNQQQRDLEEILSMVARNHNIWKAYFQDFTKYYLPTATEKKLIFDATKNIGRLANFHGRSFGRKKKKFVKNTFTKIAELLEPFRGEIAHMDLHPGHICNKKMLDLENMFASQVEFDIYSLTSHPAVSTEVDIKKLLKHYELKFQHYLRKEEDLQQPMFKRLGRDKEQRIYSRYVLIGISRSSRAANKSFTLQNDEGLRDIYENYLRENPAYKNYGEWSLSDLGENLNHIVDDYEILESLHKGSRSELKSLRNNVKGLRNLLFELMPNMTTQKKEISKRIMETYQKTVSSG